jgi:hypothetical protein
MSSPEKRGFSNAFYFYRENPFSEPVSIQTEDHHPGESRGPEHVEIPLWRNWIAAFAAMTGRFSSPGVATLGMSIYAVMICPVSNWISTFR